MIDVNLRSFEGDEGESQWRSLQMDASRLAVELGSCEEFVTDQGDFGEFGTA